jgi:hypothetical protein
MRFLSYLVTLLLASLITACGGGGGSPGTVSGPAALRTNAPDGLTLLVGTATSFSVTGGKAPYSALSNNEIVAVAGVTDGTLTIGTVGIGTAVITVRDAFGATVQVPLTSAVAHPLSTTAPSAITIEMGASQSFRISGGAPGYTVFSGNTNIAFAEMISNNSVRITGIKPGATSVLVRDGVGTTVTIGVTVTTVGNLALFTTMPPLTLPINATATFSVGGGVGPYQVISSNGSIATATLTDNTLLITALRNGTASITIRDSVGTALAPIVVTVPAPDALFSSAAAAVTIGIGSSANYTVGGGFGTRLISSSNAAVATGTLDTAGTQLTISGLSAGTANIVIRDTFGSAPLTIAVTVPAPSAGQALFTTAPAGLTIAVNSSPTFTIGGGTPGYTVVSSNTAIATGTVTNSTTLTVTGISPGSATLVVRDAAGATVNVPVSVAGNGVALFTSAPSPVTVPINVTSTYSVGGGTGVGYIATSSNPTVATVSLSGTVAGSNLLVHGVSAGTATIVLRDSAGATVSVIVNVPAANAQPLFTTAPSTVVLSVGSPQQYIVGGGTSPYFVTSNNTAVATVSQATGTFTITPVAAGTATIVLRDSNNAVISIGVTVTAANSVALFTTAPSAVSIAINTTQVYSVGSGTGTYSITNTNPSIATAMVTGAGPGGGTLTITGLLLGTTTITVFDAAGASVVLSVTVIQPGTTLVVLPTTLTISELNPAQINLQISGGTAPYLAFTNNQVLSTATINGSVLEVTVGSQTTRCVPATTSVLFTVVDAVGATANSTLSIVDNGFCLTP